MNVYIFIGLYVTVCSIFERFLKSRWAKKLFLIILFVPIFIVSSFHGNVSIDYQSYTEYFLAIRQTPLIPGIFAFPVEPGYFLINKIAGWVSSDFTSVLFLTSLMNLGIYGYIFYKYSSNFSLSLLLLLAIGNYYVSFNLIRQFLASSILILGVFNVKKGFKYYLVFVLLAASIHKSAIFMLPFYFILQLDMRKKNHILVSFVIFSLSIFIVLFSGDIVEIFIDYFYTNYSLSFWLIEDGNPISVVFKPIFALVYILLFGKFINLDNTNERLALNTIIWLLFFTVLSTQIKMLERFMYFFSPYMTVLIPNLNAKLKLKGNRLFFDSLLIVILVVYIIISQRSLYFEWISFY